MIVAAAIKFNNKIYTDSKPARHGDIFRLIDKDCKAGYSRSGAIQGFITDDLAFVNRINAAAIALETKQITSLRWPPNLYSEDLW